MDTKSPSKAWFAAISALAVLVGTMTGSAAATSKLATACTPSTSILKSPRAGSKEVQAKALNDRGDIVGFSDGADGTYRAIMWKGGKVAAAVDLGVLPGYVCLGGLRRDQRPRRLRPALRPKGAHVSVPLDERSHDRAESAERKHPADGSSRTGTRSTNGVRWLERCSSPATGAPCAGRAMARQPSSMGCRDTRGRTSGASTGTDRLGVVAHASERGRREQPGALGRLRQGRRSEDRSRTRGRCRRSDESIRADRRLPRHLPHRRRPRERPGAVWRARTAEPQLMGPTTPLAYGELVDVNDRGQAAGMSGAFTRNGFPLAKPAIWQTGLARLRPIAVPAASRRANRVVVTQLNDINARGNIVGNVFGLAAADFGALRRIDPVLWTCAFDR